MLRACALVITVAALGAGALASQQAQGQEPDVELLMERIETERLRDHVDAIDVERNAFAQPDALAAAGSYVRLALTGLGYATELDPVTFLDVTSPNVIGVSEGTSCPERIFIVGAHYDSVSDSPGADDNASGVAGMLEIARALSDTALPATVWFTAFTMEEDGLVGSRDMATRLADDGVPVVGMFSLDMIGYTTEEARFLAVVGNQASVRLTDAYRRANERYAPELPSAVVNVVGNGEEQPDTRRSDHSPFWDNGYQGMIVTDTAELRNPNYHDPTDTIDTLDFAFMTSAARAMLATTVEYLTHDGDANGEPDACSGPLAATATPTPEATPVAPTAPATAGPGATATATSTSVAPVRLPDTGGGGAATGRTPQAAIALGGVAAALGAGALSLFALRRSVRR